MNRFQSLFSSPEKKAFIPFFMLGDPSLEDSFELIKTAIDAGADALELGFPFSDPMADGPVIQASGRRALKSGATTKACLEVVSRIREISDIPIGLLMYYNLLYRLGDTAYVDLQKAGVDAVLLVDLPIEESERHEQALREHNVGCIQLIAPNTPLDRASRILSRVTAFAYVVGRGGVTGVHQTFEKTVFDRLVALRQRFDCPLVVGFGVGKASEVHAIQRAGANGVIIGSALTNLIAKHLDHLDRAHAEIWQLVASCIKRG